MEWETYVTFGTVEKTGRKIKGKKVKYWNNKNVDMDRDITHCFEMLETPNGVRQFLVHIKFILDGPFKVITTFEKELEEPLQ